MDIELEEYFIKSAATDMFRRISTLEIDIGQGMTVPISDIIENEARARCNRLLRGHLELVGEQQDIKKVLKEQSMRTNFRPINDDLPV